MRKPIDLNSLVSSYRNLSKDTFNKIQSFFKFSFKDEEVEQISFLINKLNIDNQYLNYFYIGYIIPQIGKEFDLLRFGKNYIINIEIKANLQDEDAHNQLIKNKYYLSNLDKEVKAFSYIKEDESLYYLEDEETFVKVEFAFIEHLLANQKVDHLSNIDNLFDPSEYLVSPFNHTSKFIDDNYFLTQQQQEFKKNILKDTFKFNILSGLPGTGKTLLLYDLVKNKKILEDTVVIHTGRLNNGHRTLIEKYGWMILPIKEVEKIQQINPKYIFVDETQRMQPSQLSFIVKYIEENDKIGIFSLDPKQVLSLHEHRYKNIEALNSLENSKQYILSKKIRSNKELGTFIKGLFNLNVMKHCKNTDNISIHYFDDINQARSFSKGMDREGWQIIDYTPQKYSGNTIEMMRLYRGLNAHDVLGQEFDKVLVLIGSTFFYNDTDSLNTGYVNYYDPERMLYQSVTRARKQIMLLIVDNQKLMTNIMNALNND